MSIVIVPSNTRLFHTCFLATQNFINQYPNGHKNRFDLKSRKLINLHTFRQLLKAIREKFNLIVYFKLETHKQVKKVDESMKPESFAVVKDTVSRWILTRDFMEERFRQMPTERKCPWNARPRRTWSTRFAMSGASRPSCRRLQTKCGIWLCDYSPNTSIGSKQWMSRNLYFIQYFSHFVISLTMSGNKKMAK